MTVGRVSSGTPVGQLLKASRVNYVLEGAELAHDLHSGAGPLRALGPRAGMAYVKNDTGADLARFSVMGIADFLIDPEESDAAERHFDSNFAFVGQKPDPDSHDVGRIALTQEPVKDGRLALCVLNGLSVAWLDLQDGETYTTADVIADDTEKLAAGSGGIVVVKHATGPGKKKAVINLGGGGGCPLTHEFYLDGAPTLGHTEFEYTITKGGTEYIDTVQVDYNQTASGLRSKFLTAFPALSSEDVSGSGNLAGNTAIYIEFSGRVKVAWPPTQTAVTLNNSAAIRIRQSGG